MYKVNEGHPNAVDRMEPGTSSSSSTRRSARESHFDEAAIRAAALRLSIPCLTTLSASAAAVEAIRSLQEGAGASPALQEYHRG